MLKKSAFYIAAFLFIFAGQFLLNRNLVTGMPPSISQSTLDGRPAMPLIVKGPALLYFWAEWCGICRSMQDNVSAVGRDYPHLTVAMRSGEAGQVLDYLHKNQLPWPVVADQDGSLGQRYGVRAVPALFFIDRQGHIVFTSVGYTSEWGLRVRLWLAGLL